MKTEVTVNGRSIPFGQALQYARTKILTHEQMDVRSMTTEQLEQRQKDIRLYTFLRRLDQKDMETATIRR